MPARRELTMRQLRHTLRLAQDGVSAREIGRRLGVARSTIQDNLKRAAAAGLTWPLPEDLNDDALEKRLFARAGVKTGRRHGTDPEHMPSAHRRYAAWTPDRFRRSAATIGPNTEGLVAAVLAARRHPEQGFRTCLGVLKLYRGVNAARAEAVSARALEIGAFNCKSVAALLARKPAASSARDGGSASLFDHANLRGPGYYH